MWNITVSVSWTLIVLIHSQAGGLDEVREELLQEVKEEAQSVSKNGLREIDAQ